MLGHRHEAHAALVELSDDAREVQQRPAQTVYLINDDTVDPSSLDLLEQPMKRRTVHVGSREAAVSVDLWECSPTFPSLTLNVGF